MENLTRKTQVCAAGGGPAGIMLGYLLARAGVDVVVLEKHADFFRDFRGDTIHPSTLHVMDEIGLLDDFLKVRHTEVRELSGFVSGTELKMVDLSRVPGRCKFIALMPQWDFLNFLTERARAFPAFHLEMETEARDLVVENGIVTGVRAVQRGQEINITADLVVAADGRTSTLRKAAGMDVIVSGAPIDVLWLRLSRLPADPDQTFGNIAQGAIFVMLNRFDYYQCAFAIRKGGIDDIKARGLDFLRQEIVRLVPFLKDRVGEITSWDDVKLLTVAVDHLKTWYRPGLLCIGDAAHAMSPIGGIGINLAIQDAVAAANILWKPLREKSLTTNDLKTLQTRREPPTRWMQSMQVFLQNRVIDRVLASTAPIRPPALLKFLTKFRWFRYIPAYVVGVGFRPERVRSPKV
ncbi:MAG: FAD-dependent oxidoreductase [Candidatus Eremiobacteraeota bacterium]|nr:FAD-dependent oxidoreductase [Candidatus Eremiobacteraeota bacterium]